MPGFGDPTYAIIVLALLVPFVWLGVAFRRLQARAPYLISEEQRFDVATSDTALTLTHPDGRTVVIPWDDVAAVRLRTSDEGPLAEDVFWLFDRRDGMSTISIPNRATGIADLVTMVGSVLEGFDHDAIVAAMASTDDADFTAWVRPGAEA